MPGKKILIVEDNEKNRKLIKVILKAKGYYTMEAEDARAALDQLKRETPDLILMDIGMPEIDGLELTRQIKQDESTKNIPIIAVTAHAMTGEKEKVLKAGCDAYISKPIDTNELPITIEKFLRLKNESNS